MCPTPMPTSPAQNESSGGRLVTVDGRELPLTSASLSADAKGGLCRAILRQTFKNPHAEPLAVTYLMPLPADGAVSGYAFQIGDKRIVGEVDKKQKARERFEQAIVEGRTAALVEQERSSLFTQEIGNIPPHAEVVAELTVDQKLAWLPEGAWEWRFPTVVAPRYMGEPGRVPDAARISVDVADKPLPMKMSLELFIRDSLSGSARPESPSHAVRAVADGGRWAVSFGDEGARLDRDVVVRWAATAKEPGLFLDVARPTTGKPNGQSAYGLLTIVPPDRSAEPEPLPRDLILLLDTSGSMGGQPLDQSRRVASALVDSLTDRDHLEMIEFSNSSQRWKGKAVAANGKNRKDALAWLKALHASGGTEMRTGILEALSPLRDDSQRQVVLMTDGLIGSEDEVLDAIFSRLPPACRVHAIGVGSGVNRSLTSPAARAGRGVELVIGIGEDPERAAQRIVVRTCAPLITELEILGSALEEAAPRRMPDLFAGAPAMIGLRLRPEGGELVVRGKTAAGTYEQHLKVSPVDPGQGSGVIAALFAREAVEDLELEIAASLPKEERNARIEKLGLDFQISTRLTSWVAISSEKTVDPTAPTRRESIPQELPFGMSVEGLGLRSAGPAAPTGMPMMPSPVSMGAPAQEVMRSRLDAAMSRPASAPPPPPKAKAAGPDILGGLKKIFAPREPEFELNEPAEGYAEEADDFAPARDEKIAVGAGAAQGRKKDEAKEAPKGGAASAPRIKGRVLVANERELVLEVQVGAEGLAWAPKDIVIRMADGQLRRARLDLTRTTRPGQLSSGMVLRIALVLEQPGAWSTPAAAVLVNATPSGYELEITL